MRLAAVVMFMVIAAFVCPAIGCGRPAPGAGPVPSGASPASAPASRGRIEPVRARLDAFLTGLHGAGRFDGAVIVSDASGILFEGGYGWADAGRQAPFGPDTPTDGASLAKTFTAALVLALQAEGTLDLDAPVQRWLPELPYAGVTLRHLLSHSSGIPVHEYDFFDRDLPPGTVRTSDALLRVLARRHPKAKWPPGAGFEYSSFCYDLAALAAERAGRKSWFDLLEERFLRPLDMGSAFARPARLADFPGVRTLGYRRDGERLVVNDVFDWEAFHGGSNMYVSVRDLDRWNVSFLRGPRLPQAAMAAALTPARIAGQPSGLTLGSWYRRGDDTAFWYSGHLQGFHSEVFRDLRRGWSVVYTSNNTLEPWLQKGLTRAILAVLDGGEPVAPARASVDDLPRGDRARVAGTYVLPDGSAMAVEATDGAVFVHRDGVRYEAFPIGPGAFYVPGLDFVFGFSRDPRGGGFRMLLSSNLEEVWLSSGRRRSGGWR
ncbi:MAG TPA: serine hydrolase domain-containing protein [Candidatus Polarisedimenticolia bacterium]|nr:serine hydrolase domain-containing protein [Candidatus Polarisedimenticolia bacterium]